VPGTGTFGRRALAVGLRSPPDNVFVNRSLAARLSRHDSVTLSYPCLAPVRSERRASAENDELPGSIQRMYRSADLGRVGLSL